MKENKALTESQLELLAIKSRQLIAFINQFESAQKEGKRRLDKMEEETVNRIRVMKVEVGILEMEIDQWNLSTDGKSFWREKKVKKTTAKGSKGKK